MATRWSSELSNAWRRRRPSPEHRPDADSFHLPLPGLFADLDIGSGAVALCDEFTLASPTTRARVLQDWLGSLHVEHEKALVEAFRRFVERSPAAAIVFHIEHFRHLCEREGVECPDDFPVLLQRY